MYSEADRRASIVEADRAAQQEAMIRRATELADSETLRRLNVLARRWRRNKLSARFPHPVNGLVPLLADRMMTATLELAGNAPRLTPLAAVSYMSDDANARLVPYEDGSALLQVSDANITLCQLYCHFAAEDLLHEVLGRKFRAKARRKAEVGHAILAGLLRYYFVNQRVYGLSAKLEYRPRRFTGAFSRLLFTQATSFVIGHEIAHHVLRHDLPPGGRSPRQELEADALAYRATAHAAEGELSPLMPRVLVRLMRLSGALGALVGILAIHGKERALLIRQGGTHPPATERAAKLIGEFDVEARKPLLPIYEGLLRATEEASDFTETGRPFSPGLIAVTRRVHSSQPNRYLEVVALLDALQCRPRADHAETLAELSFFLPADSLQAALDGDARTALLGWGVPAHRVESFCGSGSALAFFTVVEKVQQSFKARGVPHEACLAQAVIAARMLTPVLGGR